MAMHDLIALNCPVQQYAWGKKGAQSKVGQLKQYDPQFSLEEDQPYAEYWMGTHCNGPAQCVNPPVALTQLLKDSPDMTSAYPTEYASYKATVRWHPREASHCRARRASSRTCSRSSRLAPRCRFR